MSPSIERVDNRNGARFDKLAECDKGSFGLLKEATQLITTFSFMIFSLLLATAIFPLQWARSEEIRLFQVIIKPMLCYP